MSTFFNDTTKDQSIPTIEPVSRSVTTIIISGVLVGVMLGTLFLLNQYQGSSSASQQITTVSETPITSSSPPPLQPPAPVAH